MEEINKKTIILGFTNSTLEEALSVLEKSSGFRLIYPSAPVSKASSISFVREERTIAATLTLMLAGTNLLFRQSENTIVLYPKEEAPPQTVTEPALLTVRGTVCDQEGLPIPGAAIVVKGNTKQFAIADANGRFDLSGIEPTAVLVVSCIGYETAEVPVNRRGVITISLAQTVNLLQDVIVTGYRTIAKEHATGAYTVLSGDLLEQSPSANISSALRGLVPGMAGATVGKNDEGDDTRFMIRGMGSLGASQNESIRQLDRDPLIVVDGFPIQGVSAIEINLQSNNPFSTINPNDVESITVLKDAAATSIYGARAANGVIVITTKKGRAGEKIHVSFNAFTSISSKIDLDHLYDLASPETLFWHAENKLKWDPTYNVTDLYANPANPYDDNRKDYEMMLFECFRLGNMSEQEYNLKKAEMIAAGNKGVWKDDLNKYYYQNRIHQQYNVAIRGGSAIHNYSFSTAFDQDNSYIRGTDNQRVMLNFINMVKFGPKVTFNIGVNGSLEKTKGAAGSASAVTTYTPTQTSNTGATTSVFLGPSFTLSPWTRLLDNEGNYLPLAVPGSTIYYPILIDRYGDNLPVSWLYNPIENRKYTQNSSSRFNVRINAQLDYNITNSLKVKFAGQYERNDYLKNQVFDPESFLIRSYVNRYATLNPDTGKYDSYFPNGGMLYEAGTRYEGYMLRFQADFNKRSGDHAITVLAGSEVTSSTDNKIPEIFRYGYNKFTNSMITTVDYVTQNLTIFGVNARMPYSPPGTLYTIEDRFFSAYIDAQYTFRDRYNLTASARTDASNFQAIEVRQKFSPFWSLGAAWLISRENFTKEAKWISSLKLRASIGEAGVAAGKSGNSAIPTVSVSAGSIAFSNNEPWNTISSRGNSSLTWEKSRTFDLGIDFNLWNDKLYGGLSYYDRYSYDVLASSTLPYIMQGANSSVFNNASFSNRGMELSLGTNLTLVGDLRWNALLTFSYNKNKLVKYNLLSTSNIPPAYLGYPLNCVFAFDLYRYTPEGYPVLRGKDGTEEIAYDRTTTHYYDTINQSAGETIEGYNWTYYIGTLNPSHYLGFTNSFIFKGFILTFKLTGKFGYLFRDGSIFSSSDLGGIYGVLLEKAKKVWDEGYGNQKAYTSIPLFNADNAVVFSSNNTYNQYISMLHSASSARYYKGDHIRLNEIYLGYDLPERLLVKSKLVSGVKVYAQAKNLGMIWSLNGLYDPESIPGTLKPMTTFTFGLNFNFNFN